MDHRILFNMSFEPDLRLTMTTFAFSRFGHNHKALNDCRPRVLIYCNTVGRIRDDWPSRKILGPNRESTLVFHILGEHHNCRLSRQMIAVIFIPPKLARACPRAFQAQRSHWPSNIMVGQIRED